MAQTVNKINRAGASAGGEDRMAAVEQAAQYMVQTLPRMFKIVKQRVRAADPSCRDMGDSQMWALRMIAEGKHLTSDLARHSNVTTPTMTRVIDGLVEKGFVERRHDPEDRRRIYLDVTALGAESANRWHQQFRAALASHLSPLSSSQLADIVRAFGHLQSLLPHDSVEVEGDLDHPGPGHN